MERPLKWTKIGPSDRPRHAKYRCECGTIRDVLVWSVVNGHAKSCGCGKTEYLKQAKLRKTHGKTGSREYTAWICMIRRCYNSKAERYESWGGRGITVCDEWRTSFEQFLEDMGPCPEGYQLDRRDNDKNYCKGNCRWATRSEQCKNTRRNPKVTYNGVTKFRHEWAEELNVPAGLLGWRISHWGLEKAMTTVGLVRAGRRRKRAETEA